MTESDRRLRAAGSDSGRLAVEVIVIWRAQDGWHPATVMYRRGQGEVRVHPRWQEPFLDTPPKPWSWAWEYSTERIRDGSGGNGYTYELEAFEVEDVSGTEQVVFASAAEAVASTHGPYGDVGGTLILSDSPNEAPLVMPFVVLPDDRGHQALVATAALKEPGECTLRIDGGPTVEMVPFQCVEHWQRQGAPSWPLCVQSQHLVQWGDKQQLGFVLNDDGRIRALKPRALGLSPWERCEDD